MGPRPQIAIVGTGVLTVAGRGPEALLDALREGGRDPAPPTGVTSDLEPGFPVFEVDEAALGPCPGRAPGGRGRRSLRLALRAAADALAGVDLPVRPERVAVVVGATVGGMNHGEEWVEAQIAERGPVSARPALRHVPLWELANELARRFGFRGPAFAVTTACTSGTQAIATAADLIAAGACDAALAGGVDGLARLTYHGFAALGVASRTRCRPFDRSRDGLNLGEGAGFLLLCRADLVPADAVVARLAGWAGNTDAHHMTAPRPDGSGVAEALRAALESGGVRPDEVDWVHAHGTATPTNDAVEAAAVRSVFGRLEVPVSSTKHVTGHTLAAAGGVGAVLACRAVRERWRPGNARVEERDPACPVDLVPPEGLAGRVRSAVVSSLGFGGSSCSLVVAEPR